MTNTGSSLSTVKAKLVTLIATAIPTANVSYQPPIQADDLKGPDGTYDAIWLDNAQGAYGNLTFGVQPLTFDETYLVPLHVQCLRPDSSGTQQVADQAVETLLGKILQVIAKDASLGITDFLLLKVLPRNWTQPDGFLNTGGGHAAARIIEVEVTCRHAYTA